MRLALLISLIFISMCSFAEEARLYGTSTHFAQNKTNPDFFLQFTKGTAFNSHRDEIYWHDVEKEKGLFALTGKAKVSAETINSSAQSGLYPLVVLDYGNKLYDGGDQPYSDEGRHAFGKYCYWVSSMLDSKVRYFEIWNEWNHGMGTSPPRKTGSAVDYVKLTEICAREIRKSKPDAIIIAGSVTNDWGAWPWLSSALENGLMKYANGISVHLYSFLISSGNGQEAFISDRLNQLNTILSKYGNNHIYITEIGWPNHLGKGSVTRADAAALAVRFILHAQASKTIKGIWFYELKDSGTNAYEKEDNFGLHDYTNKPKQSYCAINKLLDRTANNGYTNETLLDELSVRTYFNKKTRTQTTIIWRTLWDNQNKPIEISISSLNQFTTFKSDCSTSDSGKFKLDHLSAGNAPIIIDHTSPLTINRQENVKFSN